MFGGCARQSRQEALKQFRAEERSQTLLRQWLSPAQAEQYENHGHFDVVGSDTATRYRIRHGAAMNILELSGDGHVVHGLCFAPEGVAAVGDVMLAQKIALEKFELGALAIANKDARRGPGVVPEVVLICGMGLMLALSVALMWLFLYDLKIIL